MTENIIGIILGVLLLLMLALIPAWFASYESDKEMCKTYGKEWHLETSPTSSDIRWCQDDKGNMKAVTHD